MGQAGGVGVDFGTATTLIAEQVSWGPASVLPLGRATSWLPSVARADGARILVGEDADDAGPEQIRSIKRAITERRESVTVAGPVGPVDVDADLVIAEILREMVRRAEGAGVAFGAGREIRLGCPAMWDGAQRRRLTGIAASVGLPVSDLTLVDEPVAAGIAWLAHRYLQHAERPTGTLLVFDMGGGTLDVAVLAVVGGPRPEVSVLASLGVPMAGDALDAAIARDIAAEMAANRIDVTMHPQPELAWGLLERAAREAKTRLTGVEEHPLVLPRQLAYPAPVRYRREQLERAFRAQMDGAESLVFSALRASLMARSGLTSAQLRAVDRASLVDSVDFVLLAGGMSRIPYVAQRLGGLFARATVYDHAGVAPEETVVAGLADTAGYARITLYRPAFDFVLEWDGGRLALYEAYTPLFEPWQVYSGDSELAYERTARAPEIPADGAGWLRAVSLTGAPIGIQLDGRALGGLPVRFGPRGVALRIQADGRLELHDGLGDALLAQAGAWPVIRGDDSLALHLI